MRVRRGNYAILFVLTVTVMLSYLAFSIDGGRIKVAQIQTENAAEAAAMAAVVAVRDGATQGEAEADALAAANDVRLQRIDNNASTEDFQLETTPAWGSWDWTIAAPADVSVRWGAEGTAVQAITVNVSVVDPIPTVFGPAIDLVNRSGGGAGATTFDFGNVVKGVRAAMRNRDVAILVDASRFNTAAMTDIQAALDAYVDQAFAFDIPGDRLSIASFAGNAFFFDLSSPGSYAAFSSGDVATEPATAFYPVSTDASAMKDTADYIRSCDITADQWFTTYRYVDAATKDLNTVVYPAGLDPVLGYYVVDDGSRITWPGTPANKGQVTTWLDNAGVETSERDAALASMDIPVVALRPTVPDTVQCALWFGAYTTFLANDPRRLDPTPLRCSDGNYWEGRPASDVFVDAGITNVDCSALGYSITFDTNDGDRPAFARSANASDTLDQRGFVAGRNPGVALLEATARLTATASSAEPVAILISGGDPLCDPNIAFSDLTAAVACQAQFDADLDAALAALNAALITTHVVRITDAPDDGATTVLDSYTTGRGQYIETNAASLGGVLADLAADVRIQVVQ